MSYYRCTLYQHPRIRWSRRRRSISETELRHKRSTYLRQYYNKIRRQSDPSQEQMDELYDKYNHDSQKPTLRHANFKLMKKYDGEFEDDDDIIGSDVHRGENFPTAVYTVYNIHGEPIAHKFYSYQPVYEPEDDDLVHRVDSSEYEDSEELENGSHITILKGGMFPDHETENNEISDNINKLKHQYFERYVDKRRKRFLSNKSSENLKKDINIELTATESNLHSTKQTIDTTKSRHKRNVHTEEFDTYLSTINSVVQEQKLGGDVDSDLLKVIPLPISMNTTRKVTEEEIAVIPLQYKNTNSTEVGRTDKREKRTSRKTDRLNQTTASVPKTLEFLTYKLSILLYKYLRYIKP